MMGGQDSNEEGPPEEDLTGIATAKGEEFAQILREILEEVEFDRLNRELQRELFGGDYTSAPCPMSESRIDYSTIRQGLELRASGLGSPKMTPRQKSSFEFLMFLETLPREDLETLFGEKRRRRIDDFLDASLFVETGDGRIRMNGLFLSSKRLGQEMHGEVIYILADSTYYVNPARVYVGPDSYELVNKLPDLRGLSGTGVDMGSGSGIQLIAALKLFPNVRKMVGYEIDKRAINVSKFNAWLNGVGDRVTIVGNEKDLEAALRSNGDQADFALSNPPFMPVPDFIEVDPDHVQMLSVPALARDASRAPPTKAGKKSPFQISLRNMWPVSGWGGPDGTYVLGPMLQILFTLIKPSGKIIIYGDFAGNATGPTKIAEFIKDQGGWELNWEPCKSSLAEAGNTGHSILPSIPAQFMAEDVMAHIISGFPELLRLQYGDILMKYAQRILDVYQSLGITHFHKGFLNLTKG